MIPKHFKHAARTPCACQLQDRQEQTCKAKPTVAVQLSAHTVCIISITLEFGTTPSSVHLLTYTCTAALDTVPAGRRMPQQISMTLDRSIRFETLSSWPTGLRLRNFSMYCHLYACAMEADLN